MKEEIVDKERSILLPFLAGTLVGGTIALLLAPKSGKELRKDIKDFTVEAKENISSTIERGKELYEDGRSAVTNAIEAGKSAFVHEKEKYRRAA